MSMVVVVDIPPSAFGKGLWTLAEGKSLPTSIEESIVEMRVTASLLEISAGSPSTTTSHVSPTRRLLQPRRFISVISWKEVPRIVVASEPSCPNRDVNCFFCASLMLAEICSPAVRYIRIRSSSSVCIASSWLDIVDALPPRPLPLATPAA